MTALIITLLVFLLKGKKTGQLKTQPVMVMKKWWEKITLAE
jgi:hypothetical protein